MRQVADAPAGQRVPGRLADEPTGRDLAAVEREVLGWWARAGVPDRSLARTAAGPPWLCYENPPAASGMPGMHHLPGLAIRDMYQRLKVMQGFHVPRRRGWNCHGLQVEVPVENELGLSGRADIEAYGPERFAARCRESALRHDEGMSALSTRMGNWAGNDAACRTMDAGFVESVWWSLRRIFDAGLLARADQVGPYCPRCQTPLSAHDIGRPDARGPVHGTAVIARFRLASLPEGASPRLRGADLLALAAAPWTLAANAAIAVHPHQTYALARRAGQDDQVIVAESQLGGVFFADADQILVGTLSDRGVLFAASTREHDYPRCLRCGAPLLFRAQSAWHIRTTAIMDRPLAGNQRIRREPGDGSQQPGSRPDRAWLGAEADWMLSRTRYWGTPLPLWGCSRGHVTCVGSLAELSELAGRDLTGLDPHRPGIDAVTIICPHCGAEGRRVPEVVDAWYDAGWLPFAQHGTAGAAAATGADARGDLRAQLVAESADQAAEWLRALMTVGGLVHRKPAFGTALRLGTVLDDSGRPMSRSLGNVVEPLPLIERYGADAARWYFAAAAPPDAARQVPDAALEEIVTTVLLGYWNSAAFLIRCADEEPGQGGHGKPGERDVPPPAARPLLDRWILSELHSLVRDVTTDLGAFGSAAACARIADFIDALSSRYLDRCRHRFLQDRSACEYLAAFATLHECIEVLTRVMAPITPFLTDHVWSLICSRQPEAPDSVHLARWPVPAPALIDDHLAGQVDRLAAPG